MRNTAAMAHAQPPPSSSSRYRPITLPLSLSAGESETLADQAIEARIAEVAYTVLTDGTVTICTVTLDTGYSVRGACACSYTEGSDPAMGEQCAYEEAMRKLRTLFGFLLTECRHLYTATTTHLRGEACPDTPR
jgi:hypothetical protein